MYGVYGTILKLMSSQALIWEMTCHTSYLQKSIYTALSNTQQMLHCFFFPHEQYSTACLLWYFAILNLDYPIPKIFFFQYLISKLLQFISCSFMAQIFNLIYCKLVKYVYKRQFSSRSTFRNMTVVQTSDIRKKHVFCIFWTTRDYYFFFIPSFSFWKKILNLIHAQTTCNKYYSFVFC